MMSKRKSKYNLGSLITALLCFYPHLVKAQIAPDATLPNNSLTITDDKTITIESGTTRGVNLFHSFEQFSVPTGNTAFFKNAPNIQNIFSRVTGNSVSNIDGLIRANGIANLFLINPNGIIFGPNSHLNIGGSFLGSTANSILFADGFEFNARNPSASPLLTVSVPVGLGLANPGNIEFQGIGHSLVDSPFSFFRGRNSSNSFQVKPGQTLAFIGGNLSLSGETLTAEGGKIELGSIDSGLVLFNSTSPKWDFDYKQVLGFKNIDLAFKSLIDTSGFNNGSIQIQGANVSLTNGSIALIQNQDYDPDGTLRVNATESLKITGFAPDRLTISGLYTESLGNGRGADLIISTPNVIVTDGNINTSSFSTGEGGNVSLSVQNISLTNGGIIGTFAGSRGKGGNLDINAAGNIEVRGVSALFPNFFSAIASNTRGSGNSGEIGVSTRNLLISDRGSIGTNAVGNTGSAGNVSINVFDSVKIIGGRGFQTPSSLSASTFSRGNAGRLTLNTSKVVIQDGGVITTSTFGEGTAGDLQINASDAIELISGSIISSAEKPPENLQQLLISSSELNGSSGNLIIDTPNLKIRDGSLVTVRNSGNGNAGNLTITANSINLDNQGSITAATAFGQGGNIKLAAGNLYLRNNSAITATAGLESGTSNGGNIEIKTDTLVGLENSDITANAFGGEGGFISITSQGIFGLESREQLTDGSDITAASLKDPLLNGEIEINTLDFDARNTLTPLTSNFVSTEQVVEGSCLARRNRTQDSFIVTGNGGLPITPYSGIEEWEALIGRQATSDESVQSERSSTLNPSIVASASWKPGDPIVEAQGIIKTADGRTSLGLLPQQVAIADAQTLVCSAEAPSGS